jgi:hypothetical protein
MISAVDSPSTSTQQSVAMITSSINQSLWLHLLLISQEALPSKIYNEAAIISRFGPAVSGKRASEAFAEWIDANRTIDIQDFFQTIDNVDVLMAKRAIKKSQE